MLLFRTRAGGGGDGGEGLIASGRRISSRVHVCEPVTMMIRIMIMIIMMKTNMMETMIINTINDGGHDVVKGNDSGRHDDEDA